MLQSLSVLCIISGMKIDKNEVLRYLKAKPDENTLNLIEKCSKELLQAVNPKTIIKEFTLGHNPLSIEGIPLKGKSIAKFLDGYSTCYLLGATLGIEADTLILKAQATDMARAVVLDACATDLIEKVCDKLLVFENNNILRCEYGISEYLSKKKNKFISKNSHANHNKEDKMILDNKITCVIGKLSLCKPGSEEYIELENEYNKLIDLKCRT